MRGRSAAIAALLALCAAGCGSAAQSSAPSPGVASVQLTSGGHKRTYLLYVPPGSTKRRLPLVLVYHGAGDDAANEETETNLLSTDKRRHNMLLAFPQGYEDTWNEGAGHTAAEQAGVNDAAFTAAILHQIESRYLVDPHSVVATGISNGALLTEYLGCTLAAELTLIAPVEGELPVSVSSRCSPSKPISVYEVHGTADPSIPYGGGHFAGAGGGTTVLSAPNSAARWATLDHCSTTPQRVASGRTVVNTYRGCRDGVSVTLATIKGGHHQWPSNFAGVLLRAMASLPSGRRAAIAAVGKSSARA